MPKVNPEIETFARIKVIGVGGAGTNAINHMIDSEIAGVEFIAINTDTQDLHHSQAAKKIHIGKNLTKGLGSGMNPEIGQSAAEETKAEIQEAIKGADMVFVAAGMGGGTGTGASPTVARTAKEQGILTIGVVTKPFSFEGQQRKKIADGGLEELEKEVDALITIPNDRLLSIAGDDMSFKDAFEISDDVLKQAVEGISELITTPGIINIDYADIQTTLSDTGSAFMGIGKAAGESRAKDAAVEAINSPLLDIAIDGAKGVLFAISGGDDLTMNEVNEIATIITDSIDDSARVIFGTIRDTKLKKGEIKVTVIATGFDTIIQKKPAFNAFTSKKEEASVTDETPVKRKKPVEEIEEIEEIDDTDDDWSAVPAFLRRGGKK
ncbi:cell division protein FtsZ [Candidatus Campbellbacteria bacterium]|nr:cell division protein FtsZ [Candidatus Campbellbacteria bacterium]|tara:strand:+ start:871 stop:2010 length:1140 start_codon:yes stop_codon:yes gene_type:complete